MGIFDELERGRTKVSQDRSRRRTARPSWPLSARLLVGAMFIFNVLLAAFLVRVEMKRPEARPGPSATSTPLTPEPPKPGSSPQLNAPANQEYSLGLKNLPVEVRPAGLPSTQKPKRPKIKALPKSLQARKTPRLVLSAQKPRAVIYPPREPASQTHASIRDIAATSSTSASVAPPGVAASFGISGATVLGKAAPPPNAPVASALAPSANGQGLTAKGTWSGSPMKVASVGLPAVEKGLVIPKMPVGPISPKIEIVPRPAGKVKNCGDDKVFIACPILHDRYETPYTSPAP